MIVIVGGCPSVGKSAVCRELEDYGFEAIHIDDFFEPGKSKYDPEHSERSYQRLFSSLGEGDYVVDTPGNAPAFLRERQRLVHYTTVKLDASWETVLERYRTRWQSDDIPPWKLKEEYQEAQALRADVVINTENLSPKEIARLIVQRLKQREHGDQAIHKDIFTNRKRPRKRDFLNQLLEGIDG